MRYNYCPTCGRPLKVLRPAPAYQELDQLNENNRKQMIRYAQDLVELYTWKQQLEQYLPTGLLDKVFLSDDAVAGERRYLTVLFADVVGFTKLSSTLDAEAVFLLMNNCFRVLVEQVYNYGGSIDKFMGDGMMALFGAPISYGNDSERAVRAALGMQEGLISFNQEILPELGLPLTLRIGITSGEAIAGMVGVKGQLSYTVMGSTVNMASRLESASSPGAILVNKTVYEQTADLFNYRALKPIPIKGVGNAVPVFEVVSHLGGVRRFSQLPLDQLSTFVGREAELQRLKQIAQDAAGNGRAVFITGEVGLGKTRLMLEWQRQLPSDLQVWSGFAQSFSQLSYDVWQQTILHGLNLQDASRQKVVDVLGDILEGDTWLPFLIFLLFGELPERGGLASLEPEQLKKQIFFAVRHLLSRMALSGPLVIIFDNLQWFDQLSRELLSEVLNLAAATPIFFCVGSLPEAKGLSDLLKQARDLLAQNCIELQLEPLSSAESELFLQQKLPVVNMPETLRDFILERTQNNPYYLEEMVSFIFNSGFVKSDEAGLVITDIEGLKTASLPGNLRSLIQAQIDMLPKGEQQLLAYASVIGSTFPASSFLRILGQIPQVESISKHLTKLVERTILTFDGKNYHFAQNMVHGTVYQTLLSERRRQMHLQVGQAIETGEGERSWAEIEQLAYHFAEAKNAPKAFPYLIEAGERAKRQFSNENALTFFSTALDLLPEVPQLAYHEPDIQQNIADLYQHIGQYDQALEHYQQALDQAISANQRIDYTRLIGRACRLKGDWAQARYWLEEALVEIAQNKELVTDVVQGRVYAEMGLFYMHRADYGRAEQWGLDAVVALEQTDAFSDLARSLNALGGAYYFQNRWHEASQQVARGYEIQHQIGDRMGIALSSSNLGVLYTIGGQWDQAIEIFEQAIATCEEVGALEMTLSNAHNNLAFLHVLRGQGALAEGHLQASLTIKRKNGTTVEVPSSLNNLGLSRLLQKDYAAAEKFVAESIALCEEVKDHDSLSEATRYLAEIKLAEGDEDSALEICQRAVLVASQAASTVNEGAALRTLARIQLAQGHCQEAKQSAQVSLRLLTGVNHIFEIAQTQVVLAAIALVEKNEADYQTAISAASKVLTKLGAMPELNALKKIQEQHSRV